MMFVVWSELGFLGFVWDSWDFVSGCWGLRAGVRWWIRESVLPLPSPGPHPGPLPPSGRGGLLVVDGGFCLGSLYFCEGALRFLRGGWAVHERPLRVAVVPVFVDGVCGMAVFLRGAVVVGGVLLALLPGIPRSCCRTVWGFAPPYVFDEGGGGPAPSPLPDLFPGGELCTTRVDGYFWGSSSFEPLLSFGHFPLGLWSLWRGKPLRFAKVPWWRMNLWVWFGGCCRGRWLRLLMGLLWGVSGSGLYFV